MISKLQAALGAATLIVAVVAITSFVTSRWSAFAPRDYEDCAESAAKDAKSKDALSVLLSVCRTKFAGRRKIGGGYTFYDSCQDRSFDISGPNPSPKELSYIKEQCLVHLDVLAKEEELDRKAQEAANEAKAEEKRRLQARQLALQPRERAAVKAIEAKILDIHCPVTICEFSFEMRVQVTNRSSETISALSFGWEFIPIKDSVPCPTTIALKDTKDVALRPGDTAVLVMTSSDGPKSMQDRVCLKLLDVKIAD